MKINEFIEYMGKNTNRTMKNEQIVGLAKKQLEIKKYLPINEKKELIDKIIYQSTYYQDGMLKIGEIDCYMYFTMFTIDAYTNLEIDNAEVCFDALSASGLLTVIVGAIGKEYNEVNTFLNMKRDEILGEATIEAQVAKFLDYVTRQVNELGSVVTNSVKDIDVKSLINMFIQN